MNAISANNAALPAGALERLNAFASESGTTPPDCILVDEGDGNGNTFSDEFLFYCMMTNLSIDWVYFGTGSQTASQEVQA